MNKNLPLIFFIVFGLKAMASPLPNCPSDINARWHNCFGTYNFSDGSKYVGEYKDDKFHGQGAYTFGKGPNEGDKYVGEFKDDESNGQGTYTWNNGSKYVGEFKDSKLNGYGTHTFGKGPNEGDKYVGEHKDGKPNGYGTYTFAIGIIKRGYFFKGKYVPNICSEMGLKKGSESFGQCVLKIIDKID